MKNEAATLRDRLIKLKPTDSDYSGLYNRAKEAKKRFKHAVRQLKRKQEVLHGEKMAEWFTGTQQSRAKFWKGVRSKLSPKNRETHIITGCATIHESAEALASHYDIEPTRPDEPTYGNPVRSWWCRPEDVHKAIRKLKHSTDPDGLHSKLLKLVGDHISPYLADLFNEITEVDELPSIFCRSVICPDLKKGRDPSQAKNYRPVAKSSNILKILESAITSTYPTAFVTSDAQFGYKAGKSTIDCILRYKEIVRHYTYNGDQVYVALLDGSMAFNRILHSTLFEDLESRDLPAPIINLLRRTYCQAKTKVLYGNETSHRSIRSAG